MHEELKKQINNFYQLATFALSLDEQLTTSDTWKEHSRQLIEESYRMLLSLKKTIEDLNSK